MNAFWAEVLRQGGTLLSMVIRTREVRPKSQRGSAALPEGEGVEEELVVQLPQLKPVEPTRAPKRLEAGKGLKVAKTPASAKSFEGQTEASYRAECLVKHFSTGAGVLKEAIDRSVDVGIIDPGTISKIREAMIIINSAEPDITAMLDLPEVKGYVDLFNSGLRNLRKAVFESRLETGGGTEEDLRALHSWAAILLDKAYQMAKEYPGTECLKII